MKKAKYYILSFIIPVVIFILICIISKIYPFGDELINVYDSYNMYPSIVMELINKIKTGSSLFYTFHAGLGTNFLSIVNLYAGSPLNLLFIFFQNNQIYLFYMLLILLKIGLSGLTMFIYLNQNDKCKRNLLFSLIYALSTFSICYSYHIMWTDALYLTPLVLLGIDKLFKNNNCIFYIIILSITILINYYIGYMICIFCVIYFIYKLISYEGSKKKIIIKFLLSSLLCGLISSVVIIPSAYALLSGRSGFLATTDYFSFNLTDIKTFFYNLLPGSFVVNDNYNEGTAVLSSSSLILVLFIYYFFNKNISLKEKITTFLIFIFFFLSITFNLFDYFWNMLSCPIWWNSRYSFLFILYMIIIAYRSFANISYLKINKIVKSVLLVIFFIIFLISFSFKHWGTSPENAVFIAFVISIIIFMLYAFLVPSKFKYKNILILIIVIIEIVLNGVYSFSLYEDRYSYETVHQDLIHEEEVVATIDDSDLSRTYDFNDSQEDNGLFYGFNSTSLFSSVYNGNLSKFYQAYFNTGGTNHTFINNASLPLLSFLNVKYILNYTDTFLNCNSDIACLNPYSLGIGYLIDRDSSTYLAYADIITNINLIYSYLVGYDVNLYYDTYGIYSYENVEYNDSEYSYVIVDEDYGTLTYEFTAEYSGILSTSNNYYMYELYINDNDIDNITMTTYINKGDRVRIVYTSSNPDDFYEYSHRFYILNLDLLESLGEEISSKSITIVEDDNYLLSGYINVWEDNQKLFLTIPYDEGITIKVDGEVVEYSKELDTFISINLSKGEHTITMEYTPKGFKTGLAMSLSGICLLIMYIIIKKISICVKK